MYFVKILFLTKQLNESMSSNKIIKSASEKEDELSSKIHIQVLISHDIVRFYVCKIKRF